MAEFTHILEWAPDFKYFKCRTGACSFTKTIGQLEEAGYIPIKTHMVFVKEDDFRVVALLRVD